MAHCFVTRRLPGPALERLARQHTTDVYDGRLPPSSEELRRRARPADALLALLTDRIDAKLMNGCPNLKAIANYAVGIVSSREHIPDSSQPPERVADSTGVSAADAASALISGTGRSLRHRSDRRRLDPL